MASYQQWWNLLTLIYFKDLCFSWWKWKKDQNSPLESLNISDCFAIYTRKLDIVILHRCNSLNAIKLITFSQQSTNSVIRGVCVSLCVCFAFDQGGNGTAFFQVQAHVAMLDKNFKLAEMHYMEQVGDKPHTAKP